MGPGPEAPPPDPEPRSTPALRRPVLEGIEGLPPTLRQLGVGGTLAYLLRAKERADLADALARKLSAALRQLGVDATGNSPQDALDAWSTVSDARLALRVEAALERWATEEKAAHKLAGLRLESDGAEGEDVDWQTLGSPGFGEAADARRRVAWQCARSREPGVWRPSWEEASVLLQVQGVAGALRVLARRDPPGPAVALNLARYVVSISRWETTGTLLDLVVGLEQESLPRQEAIRCSVLQFAGDVKRYVRAREVGRT